jgi:RNA polymerase sigma-70 factor, ECF subfamily
LTVFDAGDFMTAFFPTHPLHGLFEGLLVVQSARGEDAAQMNAPAKPEIDQVTLAMAQNGDPDAYARVIRHYQPGVARRMARFARQAGQIEELTQDVFVQAYLSLRGFAGSAPFSHWLNRIATRVGLRYWEEQKRLPSQVSEEALAGLKSAAADDRAQAARDALDLVLARLEPMDRMVIVLMHLEGKSAKEAADLLGRSVTMTKVQAFRARLRLKKIIEESPDLTRLIEEALS